MRPEAGGHKVAHRLGGRRARESLVAAQDEPQLDTGHGDELGEDPGAAGPWQCGEAVGERGADPLAVGAAAGLRVGRQRR
jgi:hypothetical protein